MADLICFMYVDVSTPAAYTIFASDAQGFAEQSEEDHGGFGIVAADANPDDVLRTWRRGFKPGRSVIKLDGSLGHNWAPHRIAQPTVPFTRIASSLLQCDWQVLSAGRWKYRDHITLGEARAHVRIVQALASKAEAHRHRILALEDNMATAASMAKGRSPAIALNFFCRRRAAVALAAEILVTAPWVETSVMPADGASRDRTSPPGPAPALASPGGDSAALQAGHGSVHRVPH